MRIDALRWLVFLSCLVGLGEVLAGEPYADYGFRSQPEKGFISEQDHYRWRPLNGDESPSGSSADSFQGGYQTQQPSYRPPLVMDYADTPPGLPRGVYRPVEKRHSITPHKDGFRFRTLTPREQQRTKRRNQEYNQADRFSSDGYGGLDSSPQQGYRFRPDKRLDKRGSANWGRSYSFHQNGPAFTEAYQAPIYRPD